MNKKRLDKKERRQHLNGWETLWKRAFCHFYQEQGITILEIVIAISIFSIAALVLLQGFAQAGKVNKKSENYLEASTLAQNIMEEVKAKSIGEMSLAFNYPIDKTKQGQSRFSFLRGKESLMNQKDGIEIRELIKNSSNEFEAVKLYKANGIEEGTVTSSTLSKDDGKTWSFVPRTTGSNRSKYYFEMRNVVASGKTFDVLVTYDASKTSNYKKDDSDYAAQNKKNDFVAPNIQKLDRDENAFFMLEKDWDKSAVQEKMIDRQYEYATSLWDKDRYEYESQNIGSNYEDLYAKPTPLDYEEVWKQTKRKLVISLSQEKGIIKAVGQYYLDASGYSDGTKYGRMDLQKDDPTVTNELNFSYLESLPVTFFSTEAGKSLNNLYIFYYPNYDCLDQGILDEIVIQNEQNLSINVYVLKQSSTSSDGTRLPTKEQEEEYKMKLLIEETPSTHGYSNWFANSSLFRAQTTLLTNLNTDISTKEVADRTTISQMTLGYSDSKTNRTLYGTGAKMILGVNGIDNEEAKDRIYNVTVEIYKAGAGENNYDGETPIITWNTSKDD